MKKLITYLFLLGSISAYAKVDIKSFHNKNFNPISSKVCGTHLEVSGSTLVVTNIIPPRMYDEMGEGCGRARNCDGRTYSVECEEDGKCYEYDEQGEKLFNLMLLEDGNYFTFKGYKMARSTSKRFYWCDNN